MAFYKKKISSFLSVKSSLTSFWRTCHYPTMLNVLKMKTSPNFWHPCSEREPKFIDPCEKCKSGKISRLAEGSSADLVHWQWWRKSSWWQLSSTFFSACSALTLMIGGIVWSLFSLFEGEHCCGNRKIDWKWFLRGCFARNSCPKWVPGRFDLSARNNHCRRISWKQNLPFGHKSSGRPQHTRFNCTFFVYAKRFCGL